MTESAQNPFSLKRSSLIIVYLTPQQWRTGLLLSLIVGGLASWFSAAISPWLGVIGGLTFFVIYHMAHASRLFLALPHIAILIACLQYVLAAWVNFYYPTVNPAYDIGDRLPLYLSYVAPALIAVAVGWGLSLVGLRPARRHEADADPGVLLELDILLAIGVIASLLGKLVHIPSLAFILLLFGNLRYLGVFGRMLLKGRGWTWRLSLVLGAEMLLAVGSTMFHDMLLWSAWTFAIWIYAFKPKPRAVMIVLAAGVLFLPALQEAKWRMRANPLEDDLVIEDETAMLSDAPIQGATAWLSYIGPALLRTITFNMEPDFIADTAVRYNQGWIINRVMSFVPEMEPYAEGRTLKDAAVAAMIPRVLSPEKLTAGGKENMLRYAGILLNEQTSMNLGYAGEMYANFGFQGGIIGCGVYAFCLGLLFRFIARRAFSSPLWWSIVPFIFYAALKAEDDATFIFNWMAKGAFVIVAVYFCFPGFRRALLTSRAGEITLQVAPQSQTVILP